MSTARRIFTREFKLAAIKEIEGGKSAGLVGRQLELDPRMLRRWVREHRRGPKAAFSGHGKAKDESREAALERKIGQMAMENDFLKKVLAALEEQQAYERGSGSSINKYKKKRRQ